MPSESIPLTSPFRPLLGKNARKLLDPSTHSPMADGSGFASGSMTPPARIAGGVAACPETDVLMQGAWYDCLMWAADEEDIRHAFEKETGMRLGKAPLDRMIDEATGFDKAVAAAFVAWFNKNIW